MSESAAQNDDRIFTLAFYIVVDASVSMAANQGLEAANQILPRVIDAIDGSPTLADVVRLGAMDFSDDARVVLRLCDLRTATTVAPFVARGGTSYAAAFRLLRQEIDRDYAQLKLDGLRVYRPAVFFITDGAPTDHQSDLEAAFAELTDASFKARPNIILFGVGDATKAMLDPWVFPKQGESAKPMRSFVARDGVEAGEAVKQIAEVLISSVVSSAQSVTTAGSGGGFIPPADEDLGDWL